MAQELSGGVFLRKNCQPKKLQKKKKKTLRHSIQDQDNPSQCSICQKYIEDDFHLILACPMKASLWFAGQKALGTTVLKLDQLWAALNFQSDTPQHKLKVVWQLHWQSSMEQKTWNKKRGATRMPAVHYIKRCGKLACSQKIKKM
ncbi:hypothetical protein BCR42DRAFT_468183 [Absidia repens]|uniref:Reverse transcriptase zinc-binding domain-containing protein n=1 Tax=Absidia repens TaxID=90262 RepID=A0A1X2I9X5_9FUNG|nr:hypothetical protein BCR42DRAFT_468183 [Absidia repens]